MIYFKHPQAIVESEHIGEGTRVWAFVHILPGAVIGKDCNICDHVFIENDIKIGDRVTIKCGVQVWDGIEIEDDVFIGPNATFTNDAFPRSKQYPTRFAKTLVRKGASIGANATILPGLTIGDASMIGAGAVVTRDVPAFAVVAGNPAEIRGYVDASDLRKTLRASPTESESPSRRPAKVRGVQVLNLPLIKDMRGTLSFAEIGQFLPFHPKRFFFVFDVPTRTVRGEHAHRELHQFMICIQGSCSVVVDDGSQREEILLDRNNIGLHVPPLVWSVQYKYSPDAVLLVLASEVYMAEDYIRDYDEFLRLKKESITP